MKQKLFCVHPVRCCSFYADDTDSAKFLFDILKKSGVFTYIERSAIHDHYHTEEYWESEEEE